MPNVTTNAAYQQILSMAIEDRSSGYEDLVSNNNALLAVMRRKGLWQTYSGPRIRQTLQVSKNVAQWYNGYDQLLNPAIDLFNDAFYDPKHGRCAGHALDAGNPQQRGRRSTDGRLRQLHGGRRARARRCHGSSALYSDGSGNGGKQLTGLATAVPITVNTGVYGGIDRSTATIWQTKTYDTHTGGGLSGQTQFTSTNRAPPSTTS